jgi:hypothetical protein
LKRTALHAGRLHPFHTTRQASACTDPADLPPRVVSTDKERRRQVADYWAMAA